MIKGVDNLREIFISRHKSTIERLKNVWDDGCEDPQELEVRRFTVESVLVSTIEEAIRAGFSSHDIARETYRLYKYAGCPADPKQAIREVIQYGARLSAGKELVDEFEGFGGVMGSASRSLRARMNTVREWSRDSAFLFGIDALDDLTGGVQPGEMMALAGAQGSMKTSLLLNGIENALDRGMLVQFYSLDMTPGEVQERRIQRRLQCHQYALHDMIRCKDPRVDAAAEEISETDKLFEVFGNDGPGSDLTVSDVIDRAQMRMPNVLCIDYLTLLRRPTQSDLDCVNEAMPKLKRLCQSCDISMIILSQMGRASKREQLSGITGGHAKGGGIVEEMVHSEIELFKDIATDSEPSAIIATVTKNRRGPSGRSYRLDYEPQCMYFTGDATRVVRAGKAAQKKTFERAELVGSNAPVTEDYRERSYKS